MMAVGADRAPGREALRFAGFVALALALHLGAFLLWPTDIGGGPNGAGEGGFDVVSLAPADGALEAIVADWDRPPEIAEPDAQAVPAQPQAELTVATEVTPDAAPDLPEPVDMRLPTIPVPDAPPAPVASPPPPEKAPPPKVAKQQAAPAKAPRPPAPAQPAARAAGAGGGPVAGVNGEASEGSLSPGARSSALAEWGGRIRARIERAKRSPQGGGAGRVLLALRVARDGRLVSVSVVQSSGVAKVDDAALTAVRRAGRFPKAPQGLVDQSYDFTLPLRFLR